MKKSLIEHIKFKGYWDSEENDPIETYEEWSEEDGIDWSKAIAENFGIYKDTYASDYGIRRYISEEWIKDKKENYETIYPCNNYGDIISDEEYEEECNKMGTVFSIFRLVR